MQTKGQQRKTVLIAGIGTSPAVLTETVWALAHQKKPVVPDEVVVITTTVGKRRLKDEILEGHPSVWEQLKDALRKDKAKVDGKLKFNEDRVKVMRDSEDCPMDDLRIGKDNLSAADFMLHELRAYTNESDTTVLCSIAGGRKTMSALLFSCMTLVGREDDKVYHVLIPPEYDGSNLKPIFYFPKRGMTHELLERGKPTGKKISSQRIGIDLFEVPFVRMYGWYQGKFKTSPPRYSTLVYRIQQMVTPAMLPKIVIDASAGTCHIGDKIIDKLSATSFALLLLICRGVVDQDAQFELLMHMANHVLPNEKNSPKWFSNFRDSKRVQEDENGRKPEFNIVTRLAHELRTALDRYGLEDSVIKRLVSKRGSHAEPYPKDRIRVSGDSFLADVSGYPIPAAAT